jgi:hypothetical protein
MGSKVGNPRMEVVSTWKIWGAYGAYAEILLWQIYVTCNGLKMLMGELPRSIGDESYMKVDPISESLLPR